MRAVQFGIPRSAATMQSTIAGASTATAGSWCERMTNKLVLIRARLTESEWKRIRTLAIKRDTTTADLVADTLRDALLKGAKP